MKIGLFLTALLLMLAIPGAAVLAQGPTSTPTPTLRPIPPTATSVYLYLRPTPTGLTMIPVNVTLDLHMDAGQTADQTINLWRYYNKDHLFDFLLSGMLVLIGVGMLVRMITRNTNTNN